MDQRTFGQWRTLLDKNVNTQAMTYKDEVSLITRTPQFGFGATFISADTTRDVDSYPRQFPFELANSISNCPQKTRLRVANVGLSHRYVVVARHLFQTICSCRCCCGSIRPLLLRW